MPKATATKAETIRYYEREGILPAADRTDSNYRDYSDEHLATLTFVRRARELGFSVMVGCMVGTSLAMAPAVLLAQDADYVDLDGPLLLARDRRPGLSFTGTLISPPGPELWG